MSRLVRQRFLEYLQSEKRYSSHTVTAYRTDLEQFSIYLAESGAPVTAEEAGSTLIRSWLAGLMEQGVGARSVNRKLSSLKSFYRFLLREGRITENPMRKVVSPRMAKRLPAFAGQRDLIRVLDGEEEFGGDFPGWRDRAVMELFYLTGMRLSELTALQESDIDFAAGTIKVRGKRNKERLIPFGKKAEVFLQKYLAVKRDCFGETPGVVLTDRGLPAYPRLIYRIVTRHLGRVDRLERRSPHVLRHTFATHMLDNGAELNAVKEILGHASLAATQVYTHNSIDKLKRIYKQAHPKA